MLGFIWNLSSQKKKMEEDLSSLELELENLRIRNISLREEVVALNESLRKHSRLLKEATNNPKIRPCHKHKHRSRAKVKKAYRNLDYAIEAYHCEKCGFWHGTSKKGKL